MAQFSSRERLIASVLSATPRLKILIKKVYVSLNFVLHRKGYRKLDTVYCGGRRLAFIDVSSLTH